MLKNLEEVEIWTGNIAVAEAAIRCGPEIVAAYPITPSTPIIQHLSDAISEGRLRGDFIAVESEHAAMSGAVGASVAGARTFTATASQGLLYMMEMIYWAGYGRLPMSMCLVNRALAPGWSIWVDHQDMYSMRDAGWLQWVAKNNQEAHDLVVHSFRVSEHHDVYMPSAVNIDGFVLSHVAGQVEPLSARVIEDFLPKFEPMFVMDPQDPISFGALTLPNDYRLMRQDLLDSMERAKDHFTKASAEFADLTGRDWGDLVEVYGPEHADVCIISMGTMAEEVEEAVDLLNAQGGKSYGAIRIRAFRPFPIERIM
ncbi:MAG: pyruvate ferredoxin oxidoreductase, partial [Candidatus Kariarchaeaceae archaeon]